MRRRLVAGCVWVMVTAGVSFAGVELGVRVLGLAPDLPNQYALFVEDPILPHKPRPGSTIGGRSTTDEFDFEYRHNSLGLREREIPFAKPTGTFRILALGDSFTYGAGVKAENVYLARLERKLNAREGRHPRVETVNGGIPRFFPEAERLFLEHYGLRFEPDLVLVGFVANDVIDTYFGLNAIEVLPDGRLVSNRGAKLVARLGNVTTSLYTRSHLLRILLAKYLEVRYPEPPVRGPEVFRPDGYHEPAWREVERQYALLSELARAHGAGVVLVHLPQMGPWDEDAAYPPARLAAWAGQRGVAFLDVLPALRTRGDGPPLLYWPKDRHPTDACHAIIADAIFEGLVARGLVP